MISRIEWIRSKELQTKLARAMFDVLPRAITILGEESSFRSSALPDQLCDDHPLNAQTQFERFQSPENCEDALSV
jgi:hypothetical protein